MLPRYVSSILRRPVLHSQIRTFRNGGFHPDLVETPSPEFKASIDTKIKEFKEQLQDPDHVFLSDRKAMQHYGLTQVDLSELTWTEKKNPYDEHEEAVRQYPLSEVVEAARRKYKQESTMVARYRKWLEKESWRRHMQAVYGMDDVVDGTIVPQTWFGVRNAGKAAQGMKSVQQGLISNTAIAGMKGVVFAMTGSAAILADFMHSAADVSNYGYRYVTLLKENTRVQDHKHPYGYHRLRSICADRSFFMLLGLGGVVPIVFGMKSLLVPEAFDPELTVLLPVAMFAISGGLEGLALKASYHEIQQSCRAQSVSFVRYLREGNDLMSVATFLEAASGVFGAMIGTGGVLLAAHYQSMFFDSMASLAMSGFVGGVAMLLMSRSTQALLGKTLPLAQVLEITRMLKEDPCVVAVYDVKTEVLGVNTVRFKAEIEFNAEAVTRRRINGQWDDVCRSMKTAVDQEGVDAGEDWVMKNDSLFLWALTSELKRLEANIKRMIGPQFTTIHCDLEPW